MVAAEIAVQRGNFALIRNNEVREYLQGYQGVQSGVGNPDFSTMSPDQIRDEYLTSPEVSGALFVEKGLSPSEFFQLALDRQVLAPHAKEGEEAHFDQIDIDAFVALRFGYRRRVYLYGRANALKMFRLIVSDAKYDLGSYPAAERITIPQAQKPQKKSDSSVVADPVPPGEPAGPAQPVVVFTSPLRTRRAQPPPTPFPDPIQRVPGATIAQRWEFITAREQTKNPSRGNATATGSETKTKGKPFVPRNTRPRGYNDKHK